MYKHTRICTYIYIHIYTHNPKNACLYPKKSKLQCRLAPFIHAHVAPEVADTVALVAPSQVASYIALRLIAATGGWVWHARICGGGRGCHVHMYRWRWRERPWQPWVWHRCWGRRGCRGRHGCSRRVCCIVGTLPLDLLQGMPNSNDCTAQVVAHDGQDILEEGKSCTRDRCKPKVLRVL